MTLHRYDACRVDNFERSLLRHGTKHVRDDRPRLGRGGLVMPIITINHVRTTWRTFTRGQALGIVHQLRHAHPMWLVTLEVV